MKKYIIIAAVIIFSVYMLGCKKKEITLEEMQDSTLPMSMEALTMNATTSFPTSGAKVTESKPQITEPLDIAQANLESLPPTGHYKPKPAEIQTALKNAGLYYAEIDGRIGPLTRKAIEDFQKANGLTADGKVGPKTWTVLSGYLNPVPTPTTTSRKKR